MKKPGELYIYECCSCGQHIATSDPKRVLMIYCEFTGDSSPACTTCKVISDAERREEKLKENEEREGEDALLHPDTVDAGRTISHIADLDDDNEAKPDSETLAVLGFARELIERDLVKV